MQCPFCGGPVSVFGSRPCTWEIAEDGSVDWRTWEDGDPFDEREACCGDCERRFPIRDGRVIVP